MIKIPEMTLENSPILRAHETAEILYEHHQPIDN